MYGAQREKRTRHCRHLREILGFASTRAISQSGNGGSGEERYLAVRYLRLFIAIHYVTLGCYLPKQLGCPSWEEEVLQPINVSE